MRKPNEEPKTRKIWIDHIFKCEKCKEWLNLDREGDPWCVQGSRLFQKYRRSCKTK